MSRHMWTKISSVLILCAALPVAAYAADGSFNYNYANGGYVSESPSGGSSLNGLGVDGSYTFTPNWHVFAGYSHLTCCSISENNFNLGAGYHMDLTNQLGLFVEGEFLRFNATGTSANGWGVDGGVRFAINSQFEVDGFVSHTDVNTNPSNTENTIGVRGLFNINQQWSVFASYSNNSDFNTFQAGVRFYY